MTRHCTSGLNSPPLVSVGDVFLVSVSKSNTALLPELAMKSVLATRLFREETDLAGSPAATAAG